MTFKARTGCVVSMNIVIIDDKIDRKYKKKEIERLYRTTLDDPLSKMNFKRKRKLYYRIYGDSFLQTVYLNASRHGSDYAIYIDCKPLYMEIYEIESSAAGILPLGDLANCNFCKQILDNDMEIEEQVRQLSMDCGSIFNSFNNAKDYLDLKEGWYKNQVTTASDIESDKEIDKKIAEMFPEVYGNAEFKYKDNGSLYAAIKSGLFEDAIKHINYCYYSHICFEAIKLETDFISKTQYEDDLDFVEELYAQQLQLKHNMETRNYDAIRSILKGNEEYNMRILSDKLGTDLIQVNIY